MSLKKSWLLICFVFYLQLEDGDIVCFQKSLSAEARQKLRCPDVRSFFEYRHNLQVLFAKFLVLFYIVSIFHISNVKLPFNGFTSVTSFCKSTKHSSLCLFLLGF